MHHLEVLGQVYLFNLTKLELNLTSKKFSQKVAFEKWNKFGQYASNIKVCFKGNTMGWSGQGYQKGDTLSISTVRRQSNVIFFLKN